MGLLNANALKHGEDSHFITIKLRQLVNKRNHVDSSTFSVAA